MSLYKAVFIDLDGTLLSPKGEVGVRNRVCIASLVQRGIRVVFATGRPIESVRSLVGAIHSGDPVITLSGSMVHKTLFGEVLDAQVIPTDIVRALFETCRGLEGVDNILVDVADGFYALHRNAEMEDFIGMYQKHPRPFSYDSIPEAPVLSVLIYSKHCRRAICDRLQEEFGGSAHFTYFKEYPWIEISHFHSNKGIAMALVCEQLGISMAEAVAIGDGANDLEMIAAAGLGIAMGNADDEVKAVADLLAPHHADDGFSTIMEQVFAL